MSTTAAAPVVHELSDGYTARERSARPTRVLSARSTLYDVHDDVGTLVGTVRRLSDAAELARVDRSIVDGI